MQLPSRHRVCSRGLVLKLSSGVTANVPATGIVVNGIPVRVARDVSVAAALINAGVWEFRASPTGAVRGPLCGMGSCFECRVTIDGVRHRRACMVTVRDGMRVDTASAASADITG